MKAAFPTMPPLDNMPPHAPTHAPAPAPVHAVSTDLAELDALGLGDLPDDADTQHGIDTGITRELEGHGPVIGGVRVRPITLSLSLLLREVSNEIMGGKKVGEMDNPLLAAAQFLYLADVSNSLPRSSDMIYNRPDDFRDAVIAWGERVTDISSLVSDVIDYINDSTSTRVTAELPRALRGKGDEEKNGSCRHGQ